MGDHSRKKQSSKVWSIILKLIGSAAESALAIMGTGALGIIDIDWLAVASAAGLGAVMAMMKMLSKHAYKDEVS